MLKKTITYTDYNGDQRTEDFYFNLTKAELLELRCSENGGYENLLKKIISEKDEAKLITMFKEIVLMAYGEKSLDGKRFVKTPEVKEAFSQTEAYSELFMELVTDDVKAAAFMNAIIPQDLGNKPSPVPVN